MLSFAVVLVALGGAAPAAVVDRIPDVIETPAGPVAPGEGRALQVEVFVNGASTQLIIGVREVPGGGLAASPRELRAVGIRPAREAIDADGMVRLDRLPGVTVRYDEARQVLNFEAAEAARAPRTFDFRARAVEDIPPATSDTGGVVNYTLFGLIDRTPQAQPRSTRTLSAGLEGRLFSPIGTLTQSGVLTVSPSGLDRVLRLDTTARYSDDANLITYRAGDTISGGLSWTRPIRLGGLQAQRAFFLRPDLITAPVPTISGTAAVPSAVEIFSQNARVFTGQVPAGPFEVINLPLITGAGTARVLVRDTLGRDVVTEVPYFASSRLLNDGLIDFSGELGFARRGFGERSFDYDRRPVGSATVRYGLFDTVTLEAHGEGGARLINGGTGAVVGIDPVGAIGLAIAGSQRRGREGGLANASFETGLGGVTFAARAQRTTRKYQDLASATADRRRFSAASMLARNFSFRPPRKLDQATVSIPLAFASASVSASYTGLKFDDQRATRIASLSYNQGLFGTGTFFATAFTDLADRSAYGIFAGVSFSFGADIIGTAGARRDRDGVAPFAEVAKSVAPEEGSFGFRVRDSEGKPSDRLASVGYRAGFARLEATAQQTGKSRRASLEADGSLIATGGGLFAVNRVDDAFAVVDVGVPDVEVRNDNRPVGTTNSDGRAIVTDLISRQRNRIAIDPKNLPVDAEVRETRTTVVPAERSGVVVKFGVKANANAAEIVFIGPDRKPVAVGAEGRLQGAAEPFLVGYDGRAFVRGLAERNVVSIKLPTGPTCRAEFPYTQQPGQIVVINDVVCR